ncbi:tetratricopeptide repeat protein [Neisseria weaveri]|uniref:tetratricopeptide repeat protein n=1 Tax=Neisseria weaveri TaxID=28091 RepID=UPI000D318E3F|nr:tetratricopeptide repeat protein [Neisseria weaveri]
MKKLIKEQFELIKQEADKGSAEAQFAVGVCYEKGGGVAQSDKEAFAWYRKAAAQGLAEAQFNVGVHYEKGRGVAQSDKEAFDWFKKAADQGLAKAQFAVGVRYAEGRGVAQSDKEAFDWFKKAADQGLAKAQFAVGVRYAEGRSVAQSDKEAFDWFKKAADQGLAEAQFAVGMCYEEGIGVAQSDKEAFAWYWKAAAQGLAEAQFNVGVCYEKGIGVAQSDKEAVNWYRQAAQQNDEFANDLFEKNFRSYINGFIGNKDNDGFEKKLKFYKEIIDDLNIPSKFILRQLWDIDNAAQGQDQKFKSDLMGLWCSAYQILESLRVTFDDGNECKVAHYINQPWAVSLLKGKQALRLIPLQFMNDPTEGRLLSGILNRRADNQYANNREQEDYCFIKSFSFNFDSLNQFRLYGKSNNVEASGLSLVFKQDYFLQQPKGYKFDEISSL